MKKTRRITALLLAVIMVISLQATEIFAQQTAEVEQPSMWALDSLATSSLMYACSIKQKHVDEEFENLIIAFLF